jgi:hypothetical protein
LGIEFGPEFGEELRRVVKKSLQGDGEHEHSCSDPECSGHSH